MISSHEHVAVRTLDSLELDRFRRDGLLTGFQLYSAARATAVRAAVQDILSLPSTAPCHQIFPPQERLAFDRHLDRRLIFELCTLPQVLCPIRQILGNDVMLFKSQFFEKPPYGLEIPWHQESFFWGVEKEWVTLWLAIDEATPENGAMRLITGSHTHTREHPPVPPNSNYWSTFSHAAEPCASDCIVDCSMPAGYFMLFDDLLHNSVANKSPFPRVSFTARYARPDLAGVHDLAPYPDHGCVMVSGDAKDSPLRFSPPPNSGPGLADV